MSRIQVMMWEDIFAVVDDGQAPLSDYDALRELAKDLLSKYPAGLGCLTIVPAGARPPSEEVRKALNATFETAPLRCVCWCVEGSGFQAGMVRAVLAGLRLFTHRKYATHVTSDLRTALAWLLTELDRGPRRHPLLKEAMSKLGEQRNKGLLSAAVGPLSP